MTVHLIALDWRTATQRYELVQNQLREAQDPPTIRAVVSRSIGAPQELVVPGTYLAGFPGEEMDPVARIRRTLVSNRLSRRVWRALRTDGRTAAALHDGDLIVAGDELSVRAVWHLSRSSGLPGIARPTGVRVALRLGLVAQGC